MRELQLPDTGQIVLFYDDIKEMPMRVLNAFNTAILQDSGMGSNLQDLDNRLAKLDALLDARKIEEAIAERQNMRLGLFFMLEQINTKSNSLAHLVHSIGGRTVLHKTDADLTKTVKALEEGGIKYGDVVLLVEEIEKKYLRI